jgi:MYXO-CTERM domain-containing protein
VTDTALPSAAMLAPLSATFLVNGGEFQSSGPATVTFAPTEVPKPPGLAILAIGLGGVAAVRRRVASA